MVPYSASKTEVQKEQEETPICILSSRIVNLCHPVN
jgi:hypothetical protein